MASSVAPIFARRLGCLKGLQRTSCPSLMVEVLAASAAVVVQHSNLGSPGFRYIPIRWSLVHALWYPRASQWRTSSRMSLYLGRSGLMNTPNSTLMAE